MCLINEIKVCTTKVKGCVCYIFVNLFFKSNREQLWNLEKCFLFHFKSSFHSREKRILDIQVSWCHQMAKCKTRNTFYWITWVVNRDC